MEPRNYEAGAGGSAPATPVTPSNGYPTDGSPLTATPATKPGAHWFYKIGESLRNVITGAGLAPSDESLTQLKDAIILLSTGTPATETAKGIAEIATQAETDDGEDDERFVTPKKLRWGFLMLLATNGYLVFPSWMGGFIIQWGYQSRTGATVPVTFPIAYPNAAFNVVISSNNSSGIAETGAGNLTSAGFTINFDASSAIDGGFWQSIGH